MAEKEFTGLAAEVNKVSFNYNNIKAVDELSLQVPTGISLGLLGPNGAGKTTLIRLLVGRHCRLTTLHQWGGVDPCREINIKSPVSQIVVKYKLC